MKKWRNEEQGPASITLDQPTLLYHANNYLSIWNFLQFQTLLANKGEKKIWKKSQKHLYIKSTESDTTKNLKLRFILSKRYCLQKKNSQPSNSCSDLFALFRQILSFFLSFFNVLPASFIDPTYFNWFSTCLHSWKKRGN